MTTTDPQQTITAVDPGILDNVCRTLQVTPEEVGPFVPMLDGMTNTTYRFSARDQEYVYRDPAPDTKGVIDRRSEAEAELIAVELGLDTTVVHVDPDHGWKISRFVEVSGPFDYHNPEHVAEAMRLVRKLHTSGSTIRGGFDFFEGYGQYLPPLLQPGAMEAGQRADFPDFDLMREMAATLKKLTEADGIGKILCHGDFFGLNILVQGDRMDLIDWEYSGMSDYGYDMGTFIIGSDYNFDQSVEAFAVYFQDTPTPEQLRHCVAHVSIVGYHWWIWALYKDSIGTPPGDYTYLWYEFAKEYGLRALKMYES